MDKYSHLPLELQRWWQSFERPPEEIPGLTPEELHFEQTAEKFTFDMPEEQALRFLSHCDYVRGFQWGDGSTIDDYLDCRNHKCIEVATFKGHCVIHITDFG